MWVHVAPIAQHCKGTFCGIEQPHSHVCACNRHTVTWTMQHSWQHCPYYGCRPLRRICRWYGVASQKGDLQLATACPNIICCTPVQAVAPHRSVYKCSLLIAFGEGPVTLCGLVLRLCRSLPVDCTEPVVQSLLDTQGNVAVRIPEGRSHCLVLY